MKTLKGVIAATTYADYQTPLADSNLFIEPWYFVLSSRVYSLYLEEASSPDKLEVRESPMYQGIEMSVILDTSVIGGTFRAPLFFYTGEPELSSSETGIVVGGSHNPIFTNEHEVSEMSESGTGSIIDGVFRKVLIKYITDPEHTNSYNTKVIGGSHE